jgi:hypothetical protein
MYTRAKLPPAAIPWIARQMIRKSILFANPAASDATMKIRIDTT